MRIVTFTPNPALDWFLSVPALKDDTLVRAHSETVHPGGKGINVARLLRLQGIPVLALFTAGGFAGKELSALLRACDVPFSCWQIDGPTRRTVTIEDEHGSRIKVNPPGPELPGEKEEALGEWVALHCRRGDWLVLCGSLLPGMGGKFYRTLSERVSSRGVRTVIDTSGAALREGVEGPLSLLKVNLLELSHLTGKLHGSIEDAFSDDVVAGLSKKMTLLVSGGAQGAVVSEKETRWKAFSVKTRKGLAVGAGDSLLAGYLATRVQGRSPQEALINGVAMATATVFSPVHALASPPEGGKYLAYIKSFPLESEGS
ncbi:MAG: 1-phosphofructokinase family hexose kinase [Candidatus Eremiobacteraeota bacterium]|nr:1-phosphofructokinase family hexose kinase [Candidatus Eremiobacteraeota bacterium]